MRFSLEDCALGAPKGTDMQWDGFVHRKPIPKSGFGLPLQQISPTFDSSYVGQGSGAGLTSKPVPG